MNDFGEETERANIPKEFLFDKNEYPTSQRLVVQRDSHMSRVNKVLLVYKAFYFVFYSSLGATLPFFAGYFRQIGLTGSYMWTLSAVRPFAHMCFSPLWAILADRYLVSKKMILQFSLFVWFVLVISLAFVEPTDQRCEFVSMNQTDSEVLNSTLLKTGFFRRRSVDDQKLKEKHSVQDVHRLATLPKNDGRLDLKEEKTFGSASGFPPSEEEASGNGPFRLNTSAPTHSKNKTSGHLIRFIPKAASLTTQVNFTTRNEFKNSPSRLHSIFLMTLVLVLLCELFLCPVFVLVDAVVLSKQTEERFSYGHQRLFGSVGYSVVFLIVWLLLNNSLRPVCGAVYADYVICFCCFCVVTLLTLALSGRLDFPHHPPEPDSYTRLKAIFHNRHHGTFAVAICFAGFSHAVISNFFNKFLEESSEKNGVIGVVKFFYFLGEPVGFLLSSLIINRSGSINVLFAVLTSYTVNLFACSFISSPWHLLPLGFLDSLTFAVSWVVCATYVINSAPRDCAAIVQGIPTQIKPCHVCTYNTNYSEGPTSTYQSIVTCAKANRFAQIRGPRNVLILSFPRVINFKFLLQLHHGFS